MLPRDPLTDPRVGDLIRYRHHPDDDKLTTVTVISSDLSYVEFETTTPYATVRRTLSFYSWAEKWKLNPPIDIQRFYPGNPTTSNQSVNLSPGQTLTVVVPENHFITELRAVLDEYKDSLGLGDGLIERVRNTATQLRTAVADRNELARELTTAQCTVRELNNVIAVLKADCDRLERNYKTAVQDGAYAKETVLMYINMVGDLKNKNQILNKTVNTFKAENQLLREELKRLNNTGDEVSVINNANQIRLPPYVLEGLKVKPGDTVYFVRDDLGFHLVEGEELHKSIGLEP